MKSKHELTEEELLLSSRMGDVAAEISLCDRLFHKRRINSFYACREIAETLDDWAINEAHFQAYLKAVQTYSFQGVRFMTFYKCILHNELIHIYATEIAAQAHIRYGVRLDEEVGEDELSLHDIVPSGSEMDDPRAFYLYAEQMEQLSRLPKGISSLGMDIVRCLYGGYKLGEVAKRFGIKYQRAKYEIRVFRTWAIKTFRSVQKFDDGTDKEKILDEFLGFDEDEES